MKEKAYPFSDICVDPLENIAHSIGTTHRIRDRSIMPNLKKIQADLKEQIKALESGDLTQIEAMLYSQSIVLQDMCLTIMGMMWMSTSDPHHFNTLAHLVLKTQNQCRATLATLANTRNPNRATFIKQQNNAINQQINNVDSHSETKKIPQPQNELLKDAIDETMDSGRTLETITVNTSLEALGKINRRENNKR